MKHFGSKRRRKFLGGPVDEEKTSMNFPNTPPAPVSSDPVETPNSASATALLDRAGELGRVAALGADSPDITEDTPDAGEVSDVVDANATADAGDVSDAGSGDPEHSDDEYNVGSEGESDSSADQVPSTELPDEAPHDGPASPLVAENAEPPTTVDTVPQRDTAEDTPLAREIADLTRRRSALAAEQLPLPAATRIFTVANQKGGVGKTTTTVNLAAALARGGSRVLVIDLDPQGNASTALGVDHRADTPSVYDVIIDDEPMTEIVQRSPEFEGLYCLPATIHLAGAEIELVSMVAREQRLRTSLQRFLDETPELFHYVFIDCPPSLGLLTINAFVAASEVLIPIQCEYYALEGLSQLLNNISLIERHLNPTLTVSTILLTMFDSRTNLANQVAQDVRDHFPDQVLPTPIPRSVRISEAPSYGQTVISYDTNSAGSLSYREAAAEIARRGAPN